MSKSEISVVIPTRNRIQYLLQALDSVFAQTYPASEIIVVDDGSTDGTAEKLGPFVKQGKVRYLYQNPSGVSAARNYGVNQAKSPLIAFLDSDDLFLPTKLEKQVQLFERHSNLGFVHCWFSKFNDLGEDLGVRNTSRFSGYVYPNILQEWSVLMAMPCILTRAEVLEEVGGFDEGMSWAEDLDLWRRIARKYKIDLVPEPLVDVRVHSTSTTFERDKGATGFEQYLEKAFVEDPDLGKRIKRIAKAKMYAKIGQNLLGDGKDEQMNVVRIYELKALREWPLEITAVFNWLISLLPLSLRNRLAIMHRRSRYPRVETQKL